MRYEILNSVNYDSRRSKVIKYIKRGLSYGDLDVDMVERSIRSGNRLVIEMYDPKLCGAMVVEKHGRILHITSISGRFAKKWYIDTLERLKRYARVWGCNRIHLRGRKGWKRLLLPLGFHMKQYELLVCEV